MPLLNGKWYAVQVRSNHETVAERSLHERGYTVFTPYVRAPRSRAQNKTAMRPMFQGYVFCRYERHIPHRIVDSPAVVRIVGVGATPMPVEDAEVESLRVLDGTDRDVEPWTYLTEGKRITVGSGPLRGVEGIFVRRKDRDHVVLQVTLLQRSVGVVIENEAIVPH